MLILQTITERCYVLSCLLEANCTYRLQVTVKKAFQFYGENS